MISWPDGSGATFDVTTLALFATAVLPGYGQDKAEKSIDTAERR